ncbi:collagen-like repeat preface domain-containing protein [Bacillus cereus]|uniref:collagen-like repeat preface domain-containing protein n=1 Tax=Bacillus cereus TaxID=1396 RepID=UPI0014825C1F|nr:collagen-like repeat preface domain-containing protein [Bacillus cereus]
MPPSIPITLEQQAELLSLFNNLEQATTDYFDVPTPANQDVLLDVLNGIFIFLEEFWDTSYSSVAYNQYLIVQVFNTFTVQPIVLGKIAQILQQLYAKLELFVQDVIIDEVTFNTLLQNVSIATQVTAAQPVSAETPITPDELNIFNNFLTALLTRVTDFFDNPNDANNQDLQNLMEEFYIFFRDFPLIDLAIYPQFLSGEAWKSLNEEPMLLGKVSQILQAFYGAVAQFIESFAIAAEPYENLLNQLAQTVAITAAAQANGIMGLIGPAGDVGAFSTGYMYQLATLADATVVGGADIPFSHNGPLNGITHTAGTTTVTVPTTGVYEMEFIVNLTGGIGSQIGIAVNGAVDASTVYPALVVPGGMSGQAQVSLNAGDVLTLRNNSAVPVTMSPTPAIGASMIVKQVV